MPSKIDVDLSNHIPKQLPGPVGWEILQRNARVLITDTQQQTFGLDAAQYGMLLAFDRDRCSGRGIGDLLAPTESFQGSTKGGLRVCGALESALYHMRATTNRHTSSIGGVSRHVQSSSLRVFCITTLSERGFRSCPGMARSESLTTAQLDRATSAPRMAPQGSRPYSPGVDSPFT
jgi:hypothetical protein